VCIAVDKKTQFRASPAIMWITLANAPSVSCSHAGRYSI